MMVELSSNEIAEKQKVELENYEGFPGTVTFFGDEIDFDEALRGAALGTILAQYQDEPEAVMAIEKFIELETMRQDALKFEAKNQEPSMEMPDYPEYSNLREMMKLSL